MTDARLNHLGSLLESKNRTVRREAAAAFHKFSIEDSKVVEVLSKYLSSPSWDSRVSAGDAVYAVLSGMGDYSTKREVDRVSKELSGFDVEHVMKSFRPLLSVDVSTMASGRLTARQQRQLIDQHLDLQDATGISSAGFLSDAEVLPTTSNSPRLSVDDDGEALKIDLDSCGVKSEVSSEQDVFSVKEHNALLAFVCRMLPMLADQRWQQRHGTAIALTKTLSTVFNRLPLPLVDMTAILLLQVLVLDQFNDFVSAPVRETCAQALSHLLHRTDDSRRKIVIRHLRSLLDIKGQKLWHCRQSGLLVMKYLFAILDSSPEFEECFKVVVKALDDEVDDVASCAVSTLSSFLSNDRITAKYPNLVHEVMSSIWSLLHAESKKEQLRSGLDALAIDLMSIVETWLRSDSTATLTRSQFECIAGMLDAAFNTRNEKILTLLGAAMERKQDFLQDQDVFRLLKSFYRVLLFAAPGDNVRLLENVYLTTLLLIEKYRGVLVEHETTRNCIGLWLGCLIFDHRNPLIALEDYKCVSHHSPLFIANEILILLASRAIALLLCSDVVVHQVEGFGRTNEDPCERMCSEEMRFLSDREKDSVYVTRKILAAKFLAAVIQALYEGRGQINGQSVTESLQLLFLPYLQSNSLNQALGAAVVLNEWAALYRAALIRGLQVEAPMTVVTACDAYIRTTNRQYEEMTSTVTQMSQDCNEFIEYCALRGADVSSIGMGDNVSVEDISKAAYDSCRQVLTSEKQLESLEARYAALTEWILFTKTAVRTNSTRVQAFLSSALFYFGCNPDKLTPMIRPIVECMQLEQNETVSAEVFKGAMPNMIVLSWSRNPRPYVKVLARAMDAFPSCSKRIPKPQEWADKESSIISLEKRESDDEKYAAISRNAELMLLVCSSFSVEQLPEFYQNFALDDCEDDAALLCRLELHGSLWSRVGSQLSDVSTKKIIRLLEQSNPALRYAGAKAVSTFAKSRTGDTISRFFPVLKKMLEDVDSPHSRRGATEALLRLSYLGDALSGCISLLCSVLFPRLSDPLPEVRDAAGEAFRHLIALLALEDISKPMADLGEDLNKLRIEQSDFIHVLSSPGRLPLIGTDVIRGLNSQIELRHYQKEGITWMRFLRRFGLNGILADDMGLGKTLQTLCVLAIACDLDSMGQKSKASLIVCPRTLVDHWCNEWRRSFPSRPRAVKVDELNYSRTEIVVMSYEDLKGSTDHPVMKQAWNYVVLDEGHVMRNPKTGIWRAATALKARSRLILSGTPVQNSPADLWALFTWLMPGYLGEERLFRAQFLKKILRCRSPKASEKDMQDGSEAVAKLHKLILPFVMRRLKSEVLRELPDKLVQDYECQLSDAQKLVYRFIVDRCSASRTASLTDGQTLNPLHVLIALRKVVDDAVLVTDILDSLQAPANVLAAARCGDSGKLAALGQLLNECGIGKAVVERVEDDDDELASLAAPEMPHRALIFCQWRASVHLVTNCLKSGAFGSAVSHMVLDGSVPPNERQALVDRFNADHSIDVLVLTTHIGGVGLNLTGADVVIFLDHDWNPMKDLQAIDRAHRLGQTRKVNVYRLITKGTVEEKVMSLAKFKQSTADVLIGADNRSLQSMATEELVHMFSLEDATAGGSAGPTDSATPPTKRARRTKGPELTADEQWNLAELWDESQYEQLFDVNSFVKQANR